MRKVLLGVLIAFVLLAVLGFLVDNPCTGDARQY